jgi:gamma-carbonic anhydrase
VPRRARACDCGPAVEARCGIRHHVRESHSIGAMPSPNTRSCADALTHSPSPPSPSPPLSFAGDAAPVKVGQNSAILDNALVAGVKGKPVTLGADVTVCSGAVVQGATIGDGVMVGMGAKVLAGATVGADAFIDAGAVVSAGATVGAGELWTGAPAKRLRSLSAEEVAYMRSSAAQTAGLGQKHFGQHVLSVVEVERQEALRYLRLEHNMAADAPLPVADPDVEEYYRLTAPPANSGLLRDSEPDMAAELKARAEAEVAADREEEAIYTARARSMRVVEALRLLSAARPDRAAARDKVIGELEARDPEAAAQIRAIIGRASDAAAAPATDPARASILGLLSTVDPAGQAGTPEEAAAAAEALLAKLAAHAKAAESSAFARLATTAGAAPAQGKTA